MQDPDSRLRRIDPSLADIKSPPPNRDGLIENLAYQIQDNPRKCYREFVVTFLTQQQDRMNISSISARTSQPTFPITPEAFWTEFSTALRQRWSSMVEEWYDDRPSWTAFITELLRELAPAFHCHCDCEYWPRVDLSYFDRCGGSEWGEWSREVAIEHENDSTWTNEICKLMEINAGLKVLIAYAWNRKDIEEVLVRLPAIHQSRKYLTSPCSYLLIFGPFSGDLDDFIAIRFDGTNTTEITGTMRIIPCPPAKQSPPFC